MDKDYEELTPEEVDAAEEAELPEEAKEEPPEEAKEEAKGEPEEEAKGEPKPDTVPHGAFHEEREKRKALQSEVSDLKQKLEELTKPKQEPPKEPEYADPVTHPSEHRQWLEHQLRKTGQTVETLQRGAQQERARQDVMTYAQTREQEFRSQQQDYDDALKFARDSYRREQEARYRLAGRDTADPTVKQAIANELAAAEVQLVMHARQENINPAAYVYEIAKMRGYAASQPNPAAKIEKLARAQADAQSLSTASGGPSEGEFTVSYLQGLDEAALEKLEREHPEKVRRALGG